MDLFGFDKQLTEEDKKYTTKVAVPQYLPSQETPSISSLVDIRKYQDLVEEISTSNVTKEEKGFLLKAAARHLVFDYAKIADYYAHATPEMQKLMEKSALVIIDMEDAIANGYVKLSKAMERIREETKSGIKK